MLLDPSWEHSAIKRVGSYNSEEYLMGVEDFQKRIIEKLEQQSEIDPLVTIDEIIKIIKNLKK